MHSIQVHGRGRMTSHPAYKRGQAVTVSNTGTTQKQLSKLENAKQLNHVVTGIAVTAALGFGLGGQMLRLPAAIVLALIPVVLIYLMQREPLLYVLFKPTRRSRTSLDMAFLTSGAGFFFGNREVHFVQTQTLLGYAVLSGLLCCALIVTTARKCPQFWGTMIGMILFGGLYGWGVTATADILIDRSARARYTTVVEDKHRSTHRGTSTYLVLGPWGPFQGPNDLSVSIETWERTLIGNQVCLDLHPGTLNVKWYRMVVCDDSN